MALSDSIRQLMSRMYYITEMGISTIQPTVMYSDNQAAIVLADGQGDYRRAKHIDIRYHFIRDHLQWGTLEITYIPSERQLADFLTKALRQQNTTPVFRAYVSINGVFQRVLQTADSLRERQGSHQGIFSPIRTSICGFIYFANCKS